MRTFLQRLVEPIALHLQIVQTRAEFAGERRKPSDAERQFIFARFAERFRKARKLVRHHGTDHRARNLERDARLDADAPVIILHADLPA